MIKNEVVLITGGGTGLGRAIVERFVAEGAKVAVLERSAAKIEELNRAFDRQVLAIEGDATSLADNKRAVAGVVERFGRLDCFIGNVGIWDGSLSLVDLPEEKIDQAYEEVFSVNVKSYLFGAKAAVSELLKSRGNLIFTLSNAALYPGGGGPLYTASKHAGVGLVRQLAHELAPKIRVNGVAPGALNSDLRGPKCLDLDTRSLTADRDPNVIAALSPLDFSPQGSDYVGMYLLLASRSDARTTTGAVMQCDGGLGVRGIIAISGGKDL